MALTERLVFSAIALAPLLLGLGLFYEGYRQRRIASKLSATEPTPAGDVQPEDGAVLVTGEVGASDGPIEADMLDADVVYLEKSVTKHPGGEPTEKLREEEWRPVYGDSDVADLVVRDDSGEIPVEIPPDGDVITDSETWVVDEGEDPPERVQRWLDQNDVVSADPDVKRRYKQYAIEDGATVWVFGEPVVRDGQLRLSGDEIPDQFALTDTSSEHVASKRSVGGMVLYLMGGLIPTLIGGGMLAFIWLA